MAEEKKTAAEAKAPAAKKTATKTAEKKTTAAKETAAKAVDTKKTAAKVADAKPAEKKTADTDKKAVVKKPVAKKEQAKKTVTVSEGKKDSTKTEKLAASTVRVTLVKSLASCKKTQIAIASSLGLRRPGDVTVQPDNAATQGKIFKIAFLLKVQKA